MSVYAFEIISFKFTLNLCRYCNGTVEEGLDHQDISCPEENQIVYVNLVTHICGIVEW